MAIERREILYGGGALLAAGLIAVGTQVGASKPAELELAESIEALRQAFENGDGAALNSLMDPSLSFGHSNGLIQTRAEFVNSVVSKAEVFNSLQYTNHENRVIGDVAIARHRFIADIIYQGKPINVDLGELQVWKRRNGRWMLFARQAFADK
ncbi:MAG: nuclear transport factor 2 family protein [Pseudomonadota bacterium]